MRTWFDPSSPSRSSIAGKRGRGRGGILCLPRLGVWKFLLLMPWSSAVIAFFQSSGFPPIASLSLSRPPSARHCSRHCSRYFLFPFCQKYSSRGVLPLAYRVLRKGGATDKSCRRGQGAGKGGGGYRSRPSCPPTTHAPVTP
ncbi:hypothetical protein LX36DRAFT_270744 [Colletotrichum falcatum]|nr:hypothetical protein LX36DRAFT_270744 [Colletotrichum falcatum]